MAVAALGQGVTAAAHEPDEVLAARHDVASFTELYERHVGVVYRYLAGRVSTREEAEDLTSESFQRAWSGWRAYRGKGTFRAWLFGIVRRTLADFYRRRTPSISLQRDLAEALEDERIGPEDSLVRWERAREGQALLNTLKADQQEILCLRFLADLTYAEIAQVVGKREEAVKKIAYRAIDELQRRQTE